MLLERVRRIIGDARAEWGALAWLPLVTPAYLVGLAVFGGQIRTEHWIIASIVPIIGYAGARGARFFRDAFPWLLTIVVYDMVRYVRAAVVHEDSVIGCGLRAAELRFFSVAPGVTLQDWFVAHHRPWADLLFSVPYGVFAYFALLYASYLFVVDRPRMRRYLWAFAIANFMSFVLWLVVPAAPPWYIRTHGCVIDMSVTPNEASALARVDTALGMTYFHDFYSRAASVFGAMPSMHCAYPMLGLLTAWRHATWRTRPLHILYALWMAGAALYLDHHWILDVLGGWLVAIVATAAATAAVQAAENRRVREVHRLQGEGAGE